VSSDGRVAVLNPRQYYELIQAVGSNGLVNRDVQGTALQGGQGIVEIAGIKIYKSMNIPFFGKYGTKYGGHHWLLILVTLVPSLEALEDASDC
jgi:hypothetical protein